MHHYSFQSYPCMCIVSVARTNIFKLHLALVKVWSVFCHLRFMQKFTATTPISWSDFTWGTEAGNVQTSKTRPHQISRCWQQCVLLCKLPWCLLSDLLCSKVWVVAKMRGWLSARYSRPQEKIFNSWENSLISFPPPLFDVSPNVAVVVFSDQRSANATERLWPRLCINSWCKQLSRLLLQLLDSRVYKALINRIKTSPSLSSRMCRKESLMFQG